MLTWSELAKVIDELTTHVVGGQIQKVRQPDPASICLTMRTPGRTCHLLLSAQPGGERVAQSAQQTNTLDAPTALGAWIRRHGKGRRVIDMRLRSDDRVVELQLADGMIVVELFSRSSNIYAVDRDGRLVASARPARTGLSLGDVYVPSLPPTRPLVDTETRFNSALEVDAYFVAHLALKVAEGARRERERLISRARKRLVRLEQRVDQDLARCSGADQLLRVGELLKGQLHLVQPKATEVVVDDWFDEGMPKVTIPLDPRLDGPGNVERQFRRYRRARDGALKAGGRREEVESLRAQFDRLVTLELDEVPLRDGLIELGLLSRRTARQKRVETPRKPFFEFKSSQGETILVGRGGRDNHETTFRHGRGNDHWLHTRDCPGAHVIVPCPSKTQDPHHETLLDAAALAVHHSKLRGEPNVSVSHTLRKHLRPIKGGAPGQVTVAGAKTLISHDDGRRLTRLYARKET
jgi:predicted ribosome quality control (RQC) complex YloA/Tae2 family protein